MRNVSDQRSDIAAIALVSALFAGSVVADALGHPRLALMLYTWAFLLAALRLIRWLGRR